MKYLVIIILIAFILLLAVKVGLYTSEVIKDVIEVIRERKARGK